MTTRQVKHITRAAAYANSDDFFRIFDENMNSLYLLAFLLTADHAWAEQCFVSGLEDAVEGNPVFREWAHPCGGRAIIQNAVRVVRPRPGEARGSLRSNSVLHFQRFDAKCDSVPPAGQQAVSENSLVAFYGCVRLGAD